MPKTTTPSYTGPLTGLPHLLSIEQTADITGVSKAHIGALIREGNLPFRTVKLGTVVRVVTADVLSELGAAE